VINGLTSNPTNICNKPVLAPQTLGGSANRRKNTLAQLGLDAGEIPEMCGWNKKCMARDVWILCREKRKNAIYGALCEPFGEFRTYGAPIVSGITPTRCVKNAARKLHEDLFKHGKNGEKVFKSA